MMRKNLKYSAECEGINMKKSVPNILLKLVFPVVFNIFFFVLFGAEHTAAVWISYGFIHLSYLMIILTPLFIGKVKNHAVLGLPLYGVSAAYFIITLLVSLFFMTAGRELHRFCLVIHVVITGIYAAAILVNMIANTHTSESIARHEAETAYIKQASMQLKALIGKIPDKHANRAIERAYDAMHASPAKSTAAVYELEQQIGNAILELKNAVQQENVSQTSAIAKELLSMIEERNQRLMWKN